MSLLDDLNALKSQAQELTKKRASAEASIDLLEAREKELLQNLQNEFGVSSIEEGRQLLAKLKAELAEKIRELEEEMRGSN